MKGLILKIENDKTYVMCNNGSYITVPACSEWQIGQVITLEKQNIVTKYRKRILSATAAACFAFLFLGGLYFWNAPVAYIDVTVNPEVEFTLNRFERIIAVEGLNEDGKNLIGDISFIGSTIDEAYLNLLNLLNQNGYLSTTDATIWLDVSHDKISTREKLDDVLTDLTAGYLDQYQLHCGFHSQTMGISDHENNNHHEESSDDEYMPENNSSNGTSNHHNSDNACDENFEEGEQHECDD